MLGCLLNNIGGFQSSTLLKADVFQILQNFQEHVFHRRALDNYFWIFILQTIQWCLLNNAIHWGDLRLCQYTTQNHFDFLYLSKVIDKNFEHWLRKNWCQEIDIESCNISCIFCCIYKQKKHLQSIVHIVTLNVCRLIGVLCIGVFNMYQLHEKLKVNIKTKKSK